MAQKAPKKDDIFSQLVRWVRWLFGAEKRSIYHPPRIIREQNSSICRLLLLERDTDRAVRTWRCLPRYSEGYDILLLCDTLEALPFLGRDQAMPTEKDVSGAKPPSFRGHFFATHRITVLRVGRLPGKNGRITIKCMWMADLDLLGGPGTALNVGNRYAIAVMDGAAKLLLKYQDYRLDWGDVFVEIIQHYMGSRFEPYPDEYGSNLTNFEEGYPDFPPIIKPR